MSATAKLCSIVVFALCIAFVLGTAEIIDVNDASVGSPTSLSSMPPLPPPSFHMEFRSEAIPSRLLEQRPIPRALLPPQTAREVLQADIGQDTLSGNDVPVEERNPSTRAHGSGAWKRTTAPNGTVYLCLVPGLADVAEVEAARRGTSADLRGRRKAGLVAPDVVSTFGAAMGGSCDAKADVWWTYEACWNAQVRQFHVANNGAIEKEYHLGKGPLHKVEDGATEDRLYYAEHPTHGPYLSTTYYNGTVCDLTGEPRQTELQVFCGGPRSRNPTSSSNVNLRVTEPKSCQYLVQWWSPQACIPLLRKETGVDLAVQCYDLEYNKHL